MIRINSIKMALESEDNDLRNAVAKTLRVKSEDIDFVRVFKRSVDSRDKENIFFVYSVDVGVKNEDKVLKKVSSNKNVIRISSISVRFFDCFFSTMTQVTLVDLYYLQN